MRRPLLARASGGASTRRSRSCARDGSRRGRHPGGTVTPDGGTPITMSATGYPDVGAGLTYKDAASCATLVGSLLGGATPSSAASCTGVTVPLRTGFSAGACQVYSCPTDFPTPIALSASSAQ